MTFKTTRSDLPIADLCLRTNAEGNVEPYVLAGGKEYQIRVVSIDIHKIEAPGLLLADLVAPISKLG